MEGSGKRARPHVLHVTQNVIKEIACVEMLREGSAGWSTENRLGFVRATRYEERHAARGCSKRYCPSWSDASAEQVTAAMEEEFISHGQ